MNSNPTHLEIEAQNLEEALKKASDRVGLPPGKIKYEFIDEKMRADRPRTGPVKIRIINESISRDEGLTRESKLNQMLREAQDFAEIKDGFFKLEVLGDNIYLTVFQHSGKGKQVSIDEIYKKLNIPKYMNISHADVKKAMSEQYIGKPAIVATLNPDYKDLDAKATLEVSKDKMSLFLKFAPTRGFGNFPKHDEIEKLAKGQGFNCPLDKVVIENTIKNKICNTLLLIGKGSLPQDGIDTHIEWKLERLANEKIVYYRPDGSVDFKKIYLISNVQEKQVIGTVCSATAGVPGYDVYGTPIKARPGRDKNIILGKNIAFSEDGKSVISLIAGQIKFVNGVPNAFPVFEVFGDVNYNVGNIEFAGSVTVKGTVLDGFSIKAGGNIYVENAVSEAILEAEGDIYLPHGFVGKNKGYLKAGKNVVIKFAEGGKIDAQCRVIVELAIVHSNVTAGEKIEVSGKRGQIIGGELTAGDEIIAKSIGAPMGVLTKLNLGFDTIVMEQLQRINNDISSTEKEMLKIKQAYNFLNLSRVRGVKKIEGNIDEMIERIKTTQTMLDTKWDYLKNEKEKILRELAAGRRGEVRGINIIYSGVVLNIKNVNYYVKSDTKASTLHLEDGEVRIFPL
ncbi:MAG TPA: FapA family protein [Candidatus Wallbacteria bacterium]|nr:FapA family protein [Candidatus Wallbacteria bacterium]